MMRGMALMICRNDGGYAGASPLRFPVALPRCPSPLPFPVALPLWIPAFAGMTAVAHASRSLGEGEEDFLKFVPNGGCGMGCDVAT